MPRKLIRKYLPSDEKIKSMKSLRLVAPLITDHRLWHLHRRNMAKAAAIGVFFCFMPVPLQMILAAITAIILRANLPVSVVLVWISNPLTIPPMFYFCYKLGAWILSTPLYHFDFELSFHWLINMITLIWKPLLLGSFICAITGSIIAFFLVRILWRLWVVVQVKKRASRNGKEST
jgi:uncharacterized protein